jgi:hypothetical protein
MAVTDTADVSWTEGRGYAEPSGRDRREGERAMAYWEHKLRELGGEVTVAGLDLNRVGSKDWSNRFLIAVDPVFERSSLVLYGPQFARFQQPGDRSPRCGLSGKIPLMVGQKKPGDHRHVRSLSIALAKPRLSP